MREEPFHSENCRGGRRIFIVLKKTEIAPFLVAFAAATIGFLTTLNFASLNRLTVWSGLILFIAAAVLLIIFFMLGFLIIAILGIAILGREGARSDS